MYGTSLIISELLPEASVSTEVLEEFIKHRHDVVIKRTKFDLKKAKERGHIVEGLMVAIANIDAIITLSLIHI